MMILENFLTQPQLSYFDSCLEVLYELYCNGDYEEVDVYLQSMSKDEKKIAFILLKHIDSSYEMQNLRARVFEMI